MENVKILVTCPPMIGMKNQFMPILESKSILVDTPDVVQTLSESELVKIIPEYDGWIIGDDPATARVFESGKKGKLKAAVKWGIGVDNVDFVSCRRLGISITNTPGMFGREVADIAMCYVVGLARGTFVIDRGVRAAAWPKVCGMSLAGKNVGIIGYGDIGVQAGRRFSVADMNVTVYDPFFDQSKMSESVNVKKWPEDIDKQDFLVFTCSLNEENRHMLSYAEIDKCKHGVRIVNVARGPLIDECALTRGLNSGKVHSAALDVFEDEPLAADNPLIKFDQCIFGSHNSSNTREAVEATNIRAIGILLKFLGID